MITETIQSTTIFNVTTMDAIKRIIIHCSDTLPSRDTTVADLWQWHVRDKGWYHIGYHYYIKTDGRIFACREENLQGAGVKGHNENALQICYEGGALFAPVSKLRYYADTRTEEQRHSLFLLLLSLLDRYPSVGQICGHRDLADNKVSCPCFDATLEYSWLLKYRDEIRAYRPIIIPFSYDSVASSIAEVNR